MKIDSDAIDRLKTTLDQHHPLDSVIVVNMREDLIVRWTCHSNSLEGNTLTLRETKVTLEGITCGGKSLRVHLEAVNHRDPPIGRLPARHLSGVPCDAFETTFSVGPRARFQPPPERKGSIKPGRGTLRNSHVVRVSACEIRRLCEFTLNRPATPLHDAHQGGCFMYGWRREGGQA